MSQLKSITAAGWLKDISDNFAALGALDSVYGNGLRRTARAVFDTGADDSSGNSNKGVAAHGTGVFVPANAIIVGGVVDVNTTFTDGASDSATIAISVKSANDIISAVSIATGTSWDKGLRAIVPKNNTPEATGIKLAEAKEITVTVGGVALTAGKMNIYLDYYEGDEEGVESQ